MTTGSVFRVLVTGAGGFVGPHLIDALRRHLPAASDIIATGLDDGHRPETGSRLALDITDLARVRAIVTEARPSHIINLAGLAAPAAANAHPRVAYDVHLHGVLNLATAVRDLVPDCWLIQVGSGLVYGGTAKLGRPLTEADALDPLDDYAASKAAADLALGSLARRGLRCLRLRPFNHTGPGQTPAFAVPSFAHQIARIEAGLAPPDLVVGHLDDYRDFLDVRDVARAYAGAVRMCHALEPGELLNIASGVPRRIGDVLDALLALSSAKVTIRRDPSRGASGALPYLLGDGTRAQERLGWVPELSFDQTLRDVLDDFRARVRCA